MCYLLVVEVIAVGGFILVQVAGGVGRVGRLLTWVGGGRLVRQVDGAVRGFYRSHWRALLRSVGFHYASWLVGAVEALRRPPEPPRPGLARDRHDHRGARNRGAIRHVLRARQLGHSRGRLCGGVHRLGLHGQRWTGLQPRPSGPQVVWIGLGLAILVAMGATRGLAKVPAVTAPSARH